MRRKQENWKEHTTADALRYAAKHLRRRQALYSKGLSPNEWTSYHLVAQELGLSAMYLELAALEAAK